MKQDTFNSADEGPPSSPSLAYQSWIISGEREDLDPCMALNNIYFLCKCPPPANKNCSAHWLPNLLSAAKEGNPHQSHSRFANWAHALFGESKCSRASHVIDRSITSMYYYRRLEYENRDSYWELPCSEAAAASVYESLKQMAGEDHGSPDEFKWERDVRRLSFSCRGKTGIVYKDKISTPTQVDVQSLLDDAHLRSNTHPLASVEWSPPLHGRSPR